jgi:UV DNA damage endonuclease
MENTPKIRLGYACINMKLREHGVFCSRTIDLAQINKNGIDEAKRRAAKNVSDLMHILIDNFERGIYLFRITSNLFPHIVNPKVKQYNYDINYVMPLFKMIGEYAKDKNMRLTLHIGQYAQIASPNPDVVIQTTQDLDIHSQILDAMELDLQSVNVIHVGGGYDNKPETMERFIKNFKKLPQNIKRRLVIENDDVTYNADEVLYICEQINRPMVFDIHHHLLNPSKTPIKKLMPRILKTWTNLNLRPKFHLSEQDPDKRPGAHSALIKKIPDLYLEIPKKFKIPIDVMLECKKKDQAVDLLHKKYFKKTESNGNIVYVPK